MVIQKVHGLNATGLSLSERFTMLTKAAPDRVAMQQQRRRASIGTFNRTYNYSNRLIDQVARQLELRAKRQAMRLRLGGSQTGFRHFGSESNLSGLRRSNSYGNLSQQSNRSGWKQSNGNLSRSASFSNLASLVWRGRALRGFRKRGGGQRGMRGRSRGGWQGAGQVRTQRNGFQQNRGVQQRIGFQQRRGVQQRLGFQQRRGQQRRGGQQRTNGQQGTGTQQQNTNSNGQRPQVARRGTPRGRGRGGMTRSQSQPRLLSKEELDAQLEQYMSCTKAALDQQLEDYMKDAMEMDSLDI